MGWCFSDLSSFVFRERVLRPERYVHCARQGGQRRLRRAVEQGQPPTLPDTEMQFKDAVFTAQCQLLYDRFGPHKNNLYGDVNLVNGVQWPKWDGVEPRWHRFRCGRGPEATQECVRLNLYSKRTRGTTAQNLALCRWLNSAVSRPFKLRIVDDRGEDVSGTRCRLVAGDGGVRREPPAPFPRAGLYIGIAESYEVRRVGVHHRTCLPRACVLPCDHHGAST